MAGHITDLNETEYYEVFNCWYDPTAVEMFANFHHNQAGLVCLILATVITAVQTVVMIDGIIWISKNIPHAERSSYMIWMYSVWPVFCLVSLCGLYIPKAALLSNTGANLFIFPTVYNFLSLLVDYFGGEDAMIGKMKDTPVKYNRPPCCCCCCCCPTGTCTGVLRRKKYNTLELLVMQLAVVRPVLLFLSQILMIDGTFQVNNLFNPLAPGLYLQILTVASTLVATQVLGTIYEASKPHLKQYRIGPKYMIVQFALLVCNLQNTFVELALAASPCDNPYPYKSRAYVWNCFLIIIWSLIFQPLAFKHLRTLKGNVLYLPPHLKKSTSQPGPSRKKIMDVAEEAAEEATEALDTAGAKTTAQLAEKTPLIMRRSRSVSDLRKEGYGSVMDV